MTELLLTQIISDADRKMIENISDPVKRKTYIDYRQEFYRASSFSERFDHPIHVDIELTNTCNYRCAFCEHGLAEAKKKAYYKTRVSLPKEKIFLLLKECHLIGVKSIQFNVVNEPLLYPDLIEVLRYAARLDFPDIFFMTNGSLMNRETSRQLIDAGLTKIMFSIDAASEEVYQKIRRKHGFYDRTVKNIIDLIDLKAEMGLKLPLTRVSFVVSELNKHEKERFIEYWQDRVDFIAIQNLIDLAGEKVHDKAKLKQYRCNMPYFRLAIKADGRVNPCCVFYGDDLVFGNIHETSLLEIWNSQKLTDFQAMHKDYGWNRNSVCNKCVLNTDFTGV